MTTDIKSVAGLPVFDGGITALETDSDLEAIIAENMGAEGLRPSDITRVTFPREIPQWDVDGEIVAELRGIPLRQAVRRAFYLNEYVSGSSEQPDCSSADGSLGIVREGNDSLVVTPLGAEVEIGGNCLRCPLNQWDSAWDNKGTQTKGKACREYREVALLPLDATFPIIVRIPPTQLRYWHDFCAAVTKSKRYIWETVVSLTVSKDRQNNLTLQAALMAVLPPETTTAVRAQFESMALLATAQPVIALLEAGDPGFDPDTQPF